MDYQITRVSHALWFIRWYNEPSSSETETSFLADLQALLDKADQPIYFISDLRQGCITNVETLRQLGEMTRHPLWGGSSAFTGGSLQEGALYTRHFVNLFSKYSEHEKHRLVNEELWFTPEDALMHLEAIAPGITAEIDWYALIDVA